MNEPAMRVFVSYRRRDSPGHAGRIRDALVIRFGDGNVFYDLASVAGGSNFKEAIEKAIAESTAVLAIVGPRWRRLSVLRSWLGQNDWVATELNLAGNLRKPVLPIMVDGAAPSTLSSLPNAVSYLSSINAFFVRDESWDSDVRYLIDQIPIVQASYPDVLSATARRPRWQLFSIPAGLLLTTALVIVAGSHWKTSRAAREGSTTPSHAAGLTLAPPTPADTNGRSQPTDRPPRSSNEQSEPLRDELTTQRFDNATKNLGAASLDVRLGAIYALERIAQDSPRDYRPTMEVLTAYVRGHAPWRPGKALTAIQQEVLKSPETTDSNYGDRYCLEARKIYSDQRTSSSRQPLAADVQAVLTVLGRRTPHADHDEQKLDLSFTDIGGANLQNLQFDGVILAGANLQDVDARAASLKGADLSNAVLAGNSTLSGAHLQMARFDGSYAEGTNFYEAGLEGAEFSGTCLQRAEFGRARLRAAKFENGANLQQTIFADAVLDGVSFEFANVKGAQFGGSSLKGADLRGTMNLTAEQLSESVKDKSTQIP